VRDCHIARRERTIERAPDPHSKLHAVPFVRPSHSSRAIARAVTAAGLVAELA
jgi:hypothetical protein